MIDILNERLCKLEDQVKKLKNNSAPTVPFYDLSISGSSTTFIRVDTWSASVFNEGNLAVSCTSGFASTPPGLVNPDTSRAWSLVPFDNILFTIFGAAKPFSRSFAGSGQYGAYLTSTDIDGTVTDFTSGFGSWSPLLGSWFNDATHGAYTDAVGSLSELQLTGQPGAANFNIRVDGFGLGTPPAFIINFFGDTTYDSTFVMGLYIPTMAFDSTEHWRFGNMASPSFGSGDVPVNDLDQLDVRIEIAYDGFSIIPFP